MESSTLLKKILAINCLQLVLSRATEVGCIWLYVVLFKKKLDIFASLNDFFANFDYSGF